MKLNKDTKYGSGLTMFESIWKLPYESYEHKTSHYTHADPNYQSEEVLLVEETFCLFHSIVFFSLSALVKAMSV